MDQQAIEALQMHGQDIPWLIEHWANRKPDHPALIWDPPDGEERSWTYRDLLADVHRVAAGLVERGVGRDDKVLIHADNCPEMLLSWLACATVGAVAVTTNTRSAPSEVAYFAEHTKCVGAITEAKFASHIAECGDRLQWVVTIGVGAARGTRRRSTSSVATRRRGRAAESNRCCRSASCSRRARRASRRPSCTRTRTRSGRAAAVRAPSTSAPTTGI